MELVDALHLIGQIKDIIPVKLSGLALDLSDLENSTKDFWQKISEQQEEVNVELEKIGILLNSIPNLIQTNKSNLDSQINMLQEDFKRWDSFFVNNQEELSTEMQAIYFELEHLKNRLEHSLNKKLILQKEVSTEMRNLWQSCMKNQEMLESTLQVVQQEIHNFQHQLELNLISLTDHFDSINYEIESQKEKIETLTGDGISDNLNQFKSEIGNFTLDIQNQLEVDIKKFQKTLEQVTGNQFRDNLENTVKNHTTEVKNLDDLSEINLKSSLTEDLFKEMDQSLPQLDEFLEQIQRAKNSLGL
jgi:hypothetical protein